MLLAGGTRLRLARRFVRLGLPLRDVEGDEGVMVAWCGGGGTWVEWGWMDGVGGRSSGQVLRWGKYYVLSITNVKRRTIYDPVKHHSIMPLS